MDKAIYIKTEKEYGTEEGEKKRKRGLRTKSHLKLTIYKGGQKTEKERKEKKKEEIPWKVLHERCKNRESTAPYINTEKKEGHGIEINTDKKIYPGMEISTEKITDAGTDLSTDISHLHGRYI